MHIGALTCELEPTHGWARYSLDLLSALHRAGVRVTALVPRGARTDLPFAVRAVLPVRQSPLTLALSVPVAGRELREADLIQTLIEPLSHLGAVTAGARPYVLSTYGTFSMLPVNGGVLGRIAHGRAFRRADRIVCSSTYTERMVHTHTPAARTVFIPGAVEGQRFADAVQRAQPFPKRGGVVLFVGAVRPRKGTLALVQAFDRVRFAHPDALLVLIGNTEADPAYAQQVRDAIRELGLTDNVLMPGRLPEAEVLRWYRTADVFAMPCLNVGKTFEGFGLVYLEANAAGLPVVGTRDNGGESAIHHDQTGLLVSQANAVEETAHALDALLRDPALRARLGAAGKAYALTQTWDAVAQRYIALYEDVMRERPR